ETVRALLAGDEVDIEQASLRLGYRLAQTHLAMVLWTDEPGDGATIRADSADGGTIGLLDRVASRLAAEFGSGAALTVASGASGMWAWIESGTGRPIGPDI